MNVRLATLTLSLAACGGGNDPVNPSDMATPHSSDFATLCGGGPVDGAADDHCGGDGGMGFVTPVAAQCMATAGTVPPTFGDAMFGTSGYDLGCKYRVSYTVSPICVDKLETFTIVVKSAIDGTPVTGAAPTIHAFLDDETHPAKSNGSSTQELSPGAYRVGGVELGARGKWTVRFEIFPTCTDAESSPKGYASFYVESP